MEKERLKKVLIKVENRLAAEVEEFRHELEIKMPTVVLEKRKREIHLWEDLVEIVKFYIEMKDPIKRITTGPRVTVDDNGEEHWDFGNAPIKGTDELREIVKNVVKEKPDMVNSPKHYTSGKYEVIDVIKDWLTEEEFRGYIKGNTIKYVSRERHKNGDEDMLKTIFYLNYLMHGVKSDGTPQEWGDEVLNESCCEDYDDSEGR